MSPAPLLLRHIVTSGQKWRMEAGGQMREREGGGGDKRMRKDTAKVQHVFNVPLHWVHLTVAFHHWFCVLKAGI